jgi:restriction system protein
MLGRPALDSAETGDAVAAAAEGGETPDAAIRTAHRAIEEALATELLARIRSNSFQFFEQVVVRLLLNMGYGGGVEDAGRALSRTGDNGVDGVIDQDHLGLDRVFVQAKRYRAEVVVSASEIRDFFGSLDRFRAAKGLFITTSRFSKSARDTAEGLSKRIVLIDGDQLARLMIRHNIGARIEDTLHLKKVDEDFFWTDPSRAANGPIRECWVDLQALRPEYATSGERIESPSTHSQFTSLDQSLGVHRLSAVGHLDHPEA